MHTLSSARRTCIASASAVECTATVAMPSSLQARSTRSAISPRLAIRILSNMGACEWRVANGESGEAARPLRSSLLATHHSPFASFNDHQGLAVLDRLAVLDQYLCHRAAARRRDLVHGLHRLDDQQRIAGL